MAHRDISLRCNDMSAFGAERTNRSRGGKPQNPAKVDDFSAEIVGTEQSGSSGGESRPVRSHDC